MKYPNPYSSIKIVPSPCGSGKTYQTCQYIKNNHFATNYLYVAPTIKLLKQTRRILKDLDVHCDIITHETHPTRTRAAIVEYLRTCMNHSCVLLISWESYIALPYFHRREHWNIFIDEVPQADYFYSFTLPFSQTHLRDHLTLGVSVNEKLAHVKARNSRNLKRFLEQPHDDVHGLFRPLFKSVLSENFDVFVDLDSWNSVIEADTVSELESHNRVYFLAMLNSALFEDTTILGANLQHSMLYHWLTRFHNVPLEQNPDIVNNLRFHNDENVAPRLHISYFSNTNHFSKRLRDKPLPDDYTRENNTKLMDWLEQQTITEIGEKPYLLVANNDYSGKLATATNATRIPVVSHGVNDYQDFRNLVFLTALNREPKHLSMLKNLGFDNEAIRRSTGYEVLYQNVMRTSLRNPDAKDSVNIIVFSKFEADFLVDIFRTAKTRNIAPEEPCSTVKALAQTDHNRRTQSRKLQQEILGQEQTGRQKLESLYIKRNPNSYGKLCPSTISGPGTSYPTNPQTCFVTHHKSIRDNNADDFAPKQWSIVELVNTLRTEAKVIRDSKDEGWMINPSVYVQKDPAGYRKKANFHQAGMMILDFDNGECGINDFEGLFWTNAGRGQKRSFVITNTWSRSSERLNNFRVFLFFKAPATSIEAYHAVFDSFQAKLDEHFDESGLDCTSRNPTQSFWMPCTNRNQQAFAYFKSFGTRTDDLKRNAIDPETYLATTLVKTPRSKVVPIDAVQTSFHDQQWPVSQSEIEAMKNEVKYLSEGRHAPFFKLAVWLEAQRLPEDELETHLKEVEQAIGKTSRNWTRDAMKSLRVYRRRAA
jgi:hypothetical protein